MPTCTSTWRTSSRLAATQVGAPRIAGCLAWLECRVLPDVENQRRHDLFIAEVIAARQEKVLVFTQFREVTAPLAAFLGGNALIDQRQFDVFQRRLPRQQVEALKHEAEITPPQQAALVTIQLLHLHPAKPEHPAGRHIKAAEDVHRCRFA